MNNLVLMKTSVEKDLGIYVSDDLEWHHHANIAVGNANRKFGLIKNSFKYLDEISTNLLSKSLVRPHLEYGATISSPFWKYDIDKLEQVQRRATRIEPLKGIAYEDRLKLLQLQRRRRGDLIQM